MSARLDADCWFAGWSPDGAWMYFSSNAGNAFHAWRQRFSAGDTLDPPEQITSGPTEEEGLAIAPDGRSFITAVGMKRRSVWVHDSKGERAVSLEGYALNPTFTPDGKKLVYFVSDSASAHRGELWIADLDSGLNERLLPGFAVGTGGTAVGEIAVRRFDRTASGWSSKRSTRAERTALAGAARPPIAAAPDPECRRGRAVVRSKRRRPVPRPRSRLWLCVPCPPGRHRRAESPRAPGHRKHGPSRRTGGGSRFTRARRKNGRAGRSSCRSEVERPCRYTGRARTSGGRGMEAAVHDGVRTDVRRAGSERPAAAQNAAHRLRIRCGDRRCARSPADRRRRIPHRVQRPTCTRFPARPCSGTCTASRFGRRSKFEVPLTIASIGCPAWPARGTLSHCAIVAYTSDSRAGGSPDAAAAGRSDRIASISSTPSARNR